MLGVIGIILALVVLVYLTFKGWHMGVVAIASSLLVILPSRIYICEAISGPFADIFGNFAKS